MPTTRAGGVPVDDGGEVRGGHIPEDDLAAFAFDPMAVPTNRGAEIERHIAECTDCRQRFDFFTAADEDLQDADVWEPVIGSETLRSLRELATRIAEEDRAAKAILATLLAAPAKVAWKNLGAQRRFRTGGVVRELNARAHDVCANRPLDALTFADAAISVAEALPDDAYPSSGVFELRGTAWKERANALIRRGDFTEAHESLNRAERAYGKLTSQGFGMATVALVRAAAFYQQERLPEADAMAARAEVGFAHLGDDDRHMRALHLRGSIRYAARDLGSASQLFRRVLDYGESMRQPVWIAKALYALGDCELDRGNIGEASMHFTRARALFLKSGPETDRVSTDWSIGRLLIAIGKHEEAIRQLRGVMDEFEARDMVTDAALVGLDVSDGLLFIGRMREIVPLAAKLFDVFTQRGMLTGALTALAYLKRSRSSGDAHLRCRERRSDLSAAR
ncbi:MAG: tetratricopeptide repeat protein [Thermoanaerobaculia bacterium]